MQKAWWILSCFHLIYSSFSLHIKNIIEFRRAKSSNSSDWMRHVEKNSTPWEHVWRLLGRREWHLFYQDRWLKRKKMSLTFSLEIKFELTRLSSGLKHCHYSCLNYQRKLFLQIQSVILATNVFFNYSALIHSFFFLNQATWTQHLVSAFPCVMCSL